MIAVWIRRCIHCYEYKEADFNKTFIELFYARLEHDTVMYTEYSDVVQVTQTINKRTEIS
jgi:hypothetical protein